MKTDIELAIALKRLRRSQDLTQEEFADMIGVSRVTVCAWEAGRSYPTRRTLERIDELFDTDFIGGEEMDSFAMILRALPDLSRAELKALSASVSALLNEEHD